MTKPPPSIAATSTLAMVRAADARGARVDDLLQAAGVTRELLEDPDARLPGSTVLSLWGALRDRTGEPSLQLVAPTSLPFGAYRVIDHLVGASATVGEGIRRFAGFFRLIADGLDVSIDDHGGAHCLRLLGADGASVPAVYVDYVFAALVSRIRMRIRPGLEVLRVDLAQVEPTTPGRHREVFRAPVHFGAGADRLWFGAAEWLSPMSTADPSLALLLEDYARMLAERVPGAEAGFTDRIRRTIAGVARDGGSAEDVARELAVSVRTLHRRLLVAGTTFRELSDEVKGRIARDYLSDASVSIAEVAYLLGFSDQASFNRAFRRWTREAPGQWRRQRAAGAAASLPTARSGTPAAAPPP